MQTSWSRSFDQEIKVNSAMLWKVLSDVSTWKDWNPGVQDITIDGPFETGVWFSMVLPDNEVIRSQLVDVQSPRSFVDETKIDETVIQVKHSIEPLTEERCCVTFAVKAEGPEAHPIGEGASGDFPEVLASLACYLEEKDKR
ncbi:SRPBCC family protein [Desulfovibrio inopinatus]|uniref:SRPBCC family protein n=1 Tax=Desulfovibrio inopinatus TaxID=102109 RepID=UPI000482FA89|nr:SRPBCC family protein [Desulfovibrio inopinatus]